MKVSFFAAFHVAVASGDHSADVSCATDETSLLQGLTGVRKVTEHRGKTMGPGEAHYVGCFVDDPQRDLGQMVGNTNNAATNTFAGCRAACGDSQYMSLQYGGECFCAESYGNGAQYVQVSDSECNRNVEPCSSNSHNCGGTWRQAIYEINPGKDYYVGCFVDDPQRDLGRMVGGTNNAATNTFAGCRAACGDSLFMSLQYGGECFCADSYGNGEQYVQVSDSECNRNVEPCSSNSHNCGGTWRQAIYAINTGKDHYVGCFVDDPQRDLGRMVGNTNNAATNTFAGCRAACGDSRYMSLQYGGECFCADSYGNGEQYVQVSDSECNRNVEPCSSNSHNCGGTWRQAIYEINPHESQCTGTFEAEDARIRGGVVHANTRSPGHAGFTGSSFVDYLNRDGDFVEWTVDGCSGGSATLAFRYALARGDRPLKVKVNGEVVERRLSFPATGSWATWGLASVDVQLQAGTNVVKLKATGSSGANMDSLEIF